MIEGGTNISTRIDAGNPNNVIIDAVLEVVNDSTPQLGGNLDLVGNDIVDSTGASDINILGNIRAGTMNANRFTGDLKGSVFGDDSTPIIDGTSNEVNANLNGNVTGNLTGNIIGGLGSNLDMNQFGIISTVSGNSLTPNVALFNVALGYDVGGVYANLNNPTSDTPDAAWRVRLQDGDEPTWEFQGDTNDDSMFVRTHYHYLTGGSAPIDGYGQLISHNYKDGSNTAQTMGYYGFEKRNNKHVWNVRVVPIGSTPDNDRIPLVLEEDGTVILDSIQIKDEEITTTRSNENLKLNTNGTGTIDFYGAYQFPKTIGNAGEVLLVDVTGTELTWGAGGGGGGGSSTFVGLTDTPASYAGGAADALKFVRVAAGGSSLEFVTVDSVVDATYIEGKGFLPKGGGTMSGNIDLGTNDISNGGTITATTFSGTHSGDLTGATNVTTTNLFVSTIDSSDSSAITVTPGVTMNSFLTVESSLEVLDTTTTKTLSVTDNATIAGNATVTGNATVNGTFTADNFQLSGSGAPSFSSGSDINFTAVGQLSTNAPIVPTVDNSITLGTASFKWSNVHATTFTGNVTGNVTGNLTGTADIATEITATANNTANETVYLTFVDGATGTQGIETDTDLSYNPSTNILNAGTFNGNLTATRATIGSIEVDGNNIEVASNGILRLASQGTGYIELDGNTHLHGIISYSNNEDITVTGTATPVTIDTSKQISFITTSNWVSVGADFAYGNLADGTTEGQTKTIKMVNRGEFSTNGGATFTDRYLVVNLTINGGSGTLNVSQNSEFGAVTLVWHNSSWWVIGKVDS